MFVVYVFFVVFVFYGRKFCSLFLICCGLLFWVIDMSFLMRILCILVCLWISFFSCVVIGSISRLVRLML